MCGISGYLFKSDSILDHQSRIRETLSNISHRGPDGEGIFSDERIVIGHKRLSIIDLSSGGAQPMTDKTGRYTLSYNGECYNYKSLRKELERSGIEFQSESDTEVVLQLLIKEGIEGVKKINGFFSIAFYDKRIGSLNLARDRFGIKPLYYFSNKKGFAFASELNGLTPFGEKFGIDPDALQAYLHLNYIPSPFTIFKEVKKLKPGFILSVDKYLNVQLNSYYSIENKPIDKKAKLETEIVNRLESSVQKRLISDVSLGCFLSGGLDSSAIVSLASRHQENLKTFSVVFKDQKQYDESKLAALVAKEFKTEHHEIELRETDLLNVIPKILEQTDEPFSDSSGIAMYQLCKSVNPHIKVALSGDGGDELFAGYRKHLAMYYAFNYPSFSKFLKLSSGLLSKLPKSRQSGFMDKVRKVDRYVSAATKDPIERYWHWAGFGNPAAKDLVRMNFNEKLFLNEILDSEPNNMEKCLEADIKMVLEGDMLVKTDRMSMMNGLEVRVPFLDHEFVDFVNSIPTRHKIDFDKSKVLLRRSFQDILPKEILEKKKQGFEVPISKWLRKELKDKMEEVLSDQNIIATGILNLKAVKQLKLKLNSSNSENSEYALWNLMIFVSWFIRNKEIIR